MQVLNIVKYVLWHHNWKWESVQIQKMLNLALFYDFTQTERYSLTDVSEQNIGRIVRVQEVQETCNKSSYSERVKA